MASVTKGKNEDKAASPGDPPVTPLAGKDQGSKAIKDNDVEDESDLPDEDDKAEDEAESKVPARQGVPVRKESKPGKRVGSFFTIYKSGQGYWTRMGTAMGAGLLGVILAYTVYDKLPTFFQDATYGKKIALMVAGGFLVAWSVLAWWLMNKPSNADFLIATDSEMKKVNWTSRKELIGSTRIVIIFMFAIAVFLFSVDEVWGWLMYLVNVLKIKPPPFS